MFHDAPNSKFSNFECPNCHVDIPLSNQYLQKCSWIRKKGLKDDLRSLTEKWSLIERELGNLDTLKHIHAISDYLEDVVNLFQSSLLGRYVSLEDRGMNTEAWYPQEAQYNQPAQQFQNQPAPVAQQQPYPQQQFNMPMGGGNMPQQQPGAWNQPQWTNFQTPPGNFPQMPNQYGGYGFHNPSFQNPGSFVGGGGGEGNFPNQNNNFSNYFDKKMKQQQNRPPTELIQINTVGFLPKPAMQSNVQQKKQMGPVGNKKMKRGKDK